MNIRVYGYICIFIRTYAYNYTHIRVYSYAHTRMLIRIYAYTYTHIRVYLYAYYAHVLVNVYLSGTVGLIACILVPETHLFHPQRAQSKNLQLHLLFGFTDGFFYIFRHVGWSYNFGHFRLSFLNSENAFPFLFFLYTFFLGAHHFRRYLPNIAELKKKTFLSYCAQTDFLLCI